MTGLSRWQRADGFPSNAYFDAVIRALNAHGIRLADWYRDEDWEWCSEIDRLSYEDGPLKWASHGLYIGWQCDEMDAPQHVEDFTARGAVDTGWHWVPYSKRGALGDFVRDFAELSWLAEPSDVASAVARLIGDVAP